MAKLSRRTFLTVTTAVGGALTIAGVTEARAQSTQPTAPMLPNPEQKLDLALNVNNMPYHVSLDPRTTLLDTLREHIGLTGAKKGCDQGQCGACTVMLAGERVLSWLTLAALVGDRAVTTVEGLVGPDPPPRPCVWRCRGSPGRRRCDHRPGVLHPHSTPQPHGTLFHHLCLVGRRPDDLRAKPFVYGIKNGVAEPLGIDPQRIRLVSEFMGGGFGSKGSLTPRTAIVAFAAKQLKRPVKLVMTRDQGYTVTTYRAETRHCIRFGASRDGKIHAYTHEG